MSTLEIILLTIVFTVGLLYIILLNGNVITLAIDSGLVRSPETLIQIITYRIDLLKKLGLTPIDPSFGI